MRQDRPSPLDEVRSALAVFEHDLGRRARIPAVARPDTGRGHRGGLRSTRRRSASDPGSAAIATVTRRSAPEVTRRACLASRWIALTMYTRDVTALGGSCRCRRRRGTARACTPGASEPYPGRCARSARARRSRDGRSKSSSRRGQAAGRISRRGSLPRRRRSRPPAAAVLRFPARDRQRADRRRPAGRRAPPAGLLRLTLVTSTSGRTRAGTRKRSI